MLSCAVAGQGSITAPGCLAATPIEAPITVEDGYPTQVTAQHLLHLLAALAPTSAFLGVAFLLCCSSSRAMYVVAVGQTMCSLSFAGTSGLLLW